MDVNYTVATHCFTYNQAPYIEETLRGFVLQRTSFASVYVIIDDASTDGAKEVLLKWAENNLDFITYQGAYKREMPYGLLLYSRHKANENAYFSILLLSKNLYRQHDLKLKYISEWREKSKYHAFCEGDDYWTDPMKLEKQVSFLENNKSYSATAHQCQCIGAREGLFYEGVPDTIVMSDIISRARLFHTASLLYRAADYMALPPMKLPYLSGDKLEILRLSSLGPIKFFNDCMGVYRVHNTGVSSVVTLKDLMNDRNIATYMKSIYPIFPKYRFLSFLYGTFALYPKDVVWYQRYYFLLVSFILSFSYFPTNIRELALKVLRHYHYKNQ